MAEKTAAELSDQVKDKYRTKRGHHVGKYLHRGIEIDLATVDLETLDRAVANGFDIVEEIPKPKIDTTKLEKPPKQ